MKKSILLAFVLLSIIGCERDIPAGLCPDDVGVINLIKTERKALIIGIDGFRSDVLEEDVAPFMYSLSLSGGVYFTANHIVEGDTYSGPNWSSLLTGVHYSKHNVTDNSFSGNRFGYYPPFQAYLERLNPKINTASITNWTPINTHIYADNLDYAQQAFLNDSMVFKEAKKMLVDDNPVAPDVLFLQFDELDAAGHSYGFSRDVTEYVNTLHQIDLYVMNLFKIIEEKRNEGEDWIVFIVSDHGGDGFGHGDAENPHINTTVFFAQHPNLLFKNNYITNQTDLAPTILEFIGVSSPEFDCKTDGISIIQ